MEFNGKITVITGGSKGLGRALAEAFISKGSKVLITSDKDKELASTALDIGADYYVADAGDYEQTKKLVSYAAKKYGRIDIWVNNAGVQIAPSLIDDVVPSKLIRLFDTNFFGYFYGIKSVLPIMKKQHSGVIININSSAGLGGKPELSAYVSSKFAVRGLSETVREELKDSPVKVMQIFPGGIQTDIYREKVPVDIAAYMTLDYAVSKIMDNLTSDDPQIDQIIRRPLVK